VRRGFGSATGRGPAPKELFVLQCAADDRAGEREARAAAESAAAAAAAAAMAKLTAEQAAALLPALPQQSGGGGGGGGDSRRATATVRIACGRTLRRPHLPRALPLYRWVCDYEPVRVRRCIIAMEQNKSTTHVR
jgi:hypothetical protein